MGTLPQACVRCPFPISICSPCVSVMFGNSHNSSTLHQQKDYSSLKTQMMVSICFFFFFFFGNKGFLKYAHGLFRQWAYFNWAVNRLQSRKIFVTHFIVIFTLLHLQCTEDTRTDLAVSLRSASIVWCYKKNKSVTCASPPTPQWASFSVVHDIICYGKAAFEVRLSIYGHQSW